MKRIVCDHPTYAPTKKPTTFTFEIRCTKCGGGKAIVNADQWHSDWKNKHLIVQL